MRIALLQHNPKAGDCFANAAQVANLALAAHRQAMEEGAEQVLCLAPASAISGSHDFRVGGFAERCAKAAEALAAMCQTSGLSILIDLPNAEGVGLWLVSEGQVRPVAQEKGVAQLPGLRLLVVTGATTEWITEARPAADAALFWPLQPWISGRQAQRELTCATIARLWKMPVLLLQAYGATDGDVLTGQSTVFDADGGLMARAPAFADSVIVWQGQHATVSCDAVLAETETDVVYPDLDRWEGVFRATVCGIRDYVHKCGLKGAVLGLSGGMDSALVACLAVEALGPEQVLGVLMPSPWSSDHSLSDAQALAKNLGIRTVMAPIASMMNAYGGVLAPLFAEFPPRANDLTAENIQPRIRGALLMAFANRLDYLVLATGNKSEAAVGYSTLYGDTVGGIAPIGDIYKTDVYTLAHWYNEWRGQEIIPAHVFEKAPSAELRPDQFDQQSLPPYDVLDAILFALLEEGRDPLSLVEFDTVVLRDVLRRMAMAEFKRHQVPPVIRLTSCALGADWHLPAAARIF